MSVALPSVPETIFAHCARLLQDLCATSSASGDVPGLFRMAERLGRELTSCGLVSEISAEAGIDGDGQPVLVARGPGVGECGVLLLGHLDTVLQATVPEKSHDRLSGTGALDMKGGFVALIGALALLRSRDEPLPEDLVVVAVPDEEIGGPISMRTVRQWGRRARVVLVLEPGAQTPGGETLVTGRRGLTVWRLDARGKAAHSGVAYWEGRSALAAAATWAGAVQQLSQSDDGPVVNVGRIVGGDSEFVSDVGEEHRFIGTSERLNIVADRCLVEGEARFLSLADRDRTLLRMRDMAAEISASWEVDFEFREVEYIPPMVASPASQVLARHLAVSARQAGWELGLEPNRGGVSFPNFLPDPSAVCVLDGLGPVGGGMHTRSEYLDLCSLERRIHLIAEALIYVRDHR
jgi:glutamate carboxypeptidase